MPPAGRLMPVCALACEGCCVSEGSAEQTEKRASSNGRGQGRPGLCMQRGEGSTRAKSSCVALALPADLTVAKGQEVAGAGSRRNAGAHVGLLLAHPLLQSLAALLLGLPERIAWWVGWWVGGWVGLGA